MFQEGNYNITEFPIPVNGMNQFIAPDILPSNFCYSLENIIPNPMGVGQSRYGTALINESLTIDEHNIIKCFPFTLNGSVNQGILYVGYYSQDVTATTFVVADSSHFSFTSTAQTNYIKDTKIKIVYTFNAALNTLYSDIGNVSVVGTTVSITLINNLLPNPGTGALVIIEVWAQFGCIYSYNFSTNTLSAPLRTGLSIACVPRATYFQQIMMICNGVNNVMYWDGTNLNDVTEFVAEVYLYNITRIDNNNFSFGWTPGFNFPKYFVGNTLDLSINGVANILTIANSTIDGALVTITTNEVLPLFPGGANIVLYYEDKPPPFSYIYAAKDRIWALGPGAVSLQYRNTNEQLRVYYSYLPNSVTGYGLFNENTKTVPSINMSDKHEIQDNFEAICQVNGLMAFVGRQRTQIWGGYTPGQNGDFSWQSNLPVGVLHGDLLIELPNDVYFVSQSGIHSFSTLNIAKQFSASPEEAVDPIVRNFSSNATFSNTNYRACTSFKYNQGGICGFKISNNKILASLFSTRLYSWFYLSGDFSAANCFMDFGSQFYMCIRNKIFQYADGNDGSQKKYGDQDGKALISISWIPGLIRLKGNKKRYANKRYELVLDYPSSFTLNNENIIQISIFGDIPKSFSLTDTCNFDYKGDLIGQEPLVSQGGQNATGFRLRREYEIFNKRLKFVSSSFWISLSGYVMNGPITFRRIRLFGIGERNA